MSTESQTDDKSRQQQGPQGTMFFRPDEVRQHRPDGDTNSDSDVPVLIGLSEPYTEQTFRIQGMRTTIGRRGDNDIVLNENSVSATHARIIQQDGHWRILNLLSTNGTWVNGKKASETIISNGDTICFGRCEFRFHPSAAQAKEAPAQTSDSNSRGHLVAGAVILLAVAAGVAAWMFWPQ